MFVIVCMNFRNLNEFSEILNRVMKKERIYPAAGPASACSSLFTSGYISHGRAQWVDEGAVDRGLAATLHRR
jgi:hypothetical protein